MGWLYRYEAKSIQAWILASERLQEIRGGSSLIEELRRIAETHLPAGGELQYAAAGGAVCTFDDRAALEAFASTWPLRVERHAPGLELVQAWVQDGTPKPHAELARRLGAERNRRWPQLPEAGPWVARAGRTGRPAVDTSPKGGLVDRATRAREEAADLLGDRLLQGLEDVFPGRAIGFENDLQRYPPDEGVALVHADGNAIGEHVMNLGDDPGKRKAFADKLQAASLAAARHAVQGLAKVDLEEDRDALRGRPVVAGGDDFTFLVRGRWGIPLAEAWLRAFREETAREFGAPFEAAAGVAFVRRGFPFHRAHELAEALCKAAKRHSRKVSCLAFHRVTTALDEVEQDGHRAFTLDELRRLEALTAAMQRLGARGKVRTWVALKRRADPTAEVAWERLAEVARSKGGDRWRTFDRLLPDDERAAWLSAALKWSRVQPGLDRLWRTP